MDDPAAGDAADLSRLADAHPATLSGGSGWAAGHRGAALWLDGTSGSVATSGPVLRTDGSFTVAAWLYTNDVTTTSVRTVLTQEGASVVAFFIQKFGDRWAFGRPPVDGGGSLVRLTSTSVLQANTWTHVVGVYDSAAGQLRLYVNGVLNTTAACSCSWASSGPLVMGHTKWPQPDPEWWQGGVDDVRDFVGVLSQAQITALASA